MIKKALALAFIAVILVAVPVLALVPYSAPYTVTENASNSYDMLGVVGLSNNQWMADNGFMNSSANDTRIETLGGLEKPHMVSDNRTLTAIPVPANSQTNLYYTTGNSELDSFYTITGYDGYVTASDNADLELGDNFEVEQKGWWDTGIIGSPFQNAYTKKQTAFAIYNSQSGEVTAGIEGAWLDFERTNTDYVTISDEDEFSFSDNGTDQPFSVSAWVNFEDATDSAILCKAKDVTHYEWFFATDGADKLNFKLYIPDGTKNIGRLTNAVTSNESTWCHYVATYDGSETSAGINIYIDGVDSDTADVEVLPYVGITPGDSVLEIGSKFTHTSGLMDGKMGEVKIFNVELTPAQVLEEYNGGYFDNMVARWTLAEGTGLPQDSSGNGFHATANTADWDGTYVTASGVSSGEREVLVRQTTNLLTNGDFENGDPPDDWSLVGAGASVNRDGVTKRINSYSANVTRNGAQTRIEQFIANFADYAGLEVTFGAWVKTSLADRVFVSINDGVVETPSSNHPGDGEWHWLSVTQTIADTPTRLRLNCAVWNTNGTAYFDNAQLIVGSDFSGFKGNLLSNWSFENGDPPNDWGLVGAGATSGQSTDQVKIGTYSCNLTRSGANCYIWSHIPEYGQYKNEEVAFGCWVYATVADRVRLRINDGVGNAYSAYHSGNSDWEWLTATRTVDSGATQLEVWPEIRNGDTTAYFDGAVLVVGSSSDLEITRRIENLQILVDDTLMDCSGNATVPDNANDWSFITGNVMPYMEYLKFTIDGTEYLWYQPTSMIIGTNLPNEATPGSYNGTIVWGANPAGVDVSIGSMVSSSQPSIGVTGEEPASDILPPVEVSDWYVDPDVGGSLLTNPMRPIVTMLSDNSTMTEIQAWRLLALALILLVAATTARAVGRHQGLTMISVGTAIGAMVAFTIFPLWTLIFAIGMFLGGLVMERSPSL